MGGVRDGVEVRDTSIRIKFVFEGQRRSPTLMLNGEPMKPTGPHIRYAHRLAAEVRDKIRHGTFSMAESFPASDSGSGHVITFKAYLAEWLATQRLAASTLHGYRTAINFWTKALGDRALRSIKHGDILTALAARPELSGKTINNYVDVARQAFILAVRDKLVSESPVDGVPTAAWQRDPPDPFTADETERIIEGIAPEVRDQVEWWFFTGVRTSEMAGLKWAQVDLASGYFMVSEALVAGKEKGTKTNVTRQVFMNSRALAAIKRQKARTFMAGEHVWIDPVLLHPWIEEGVFRRRYWKRTLKRLGIRYRRPYNMRHTYATRMLMAGMKTPFCAKQLGHSVEVFHSTYAKWLDGEQDAREMARMEETIVPGSSLKKSG